MCEHWETLATPIGSVTDSRPRCGCSTRGSVVGRPAGRGAGRRLPAVRPRARAAATAALRRRRRPVLTGERVAGGDAAGAAALAPTSPRAGRCSSSTTRSCSRAPCAVPSEADAAVLALPDGSAIAVSIDGNGRRVACDPRARRGRGGVRVRGQPRLRRRRAARADQLPELRQPREAARRLAADARRSRGSREACEALGVPVVGGNVSLYNEAPARPDLPDAGGRDGRAAARRRARRAARVRSPRATRSRSSGAFDAVAGRLGARQAPGRGAGRAAAAAWTRTPSATRTQRSGRRSAPGRSTAPTTSPRAGSRSRSPSAASPAGSAPTVELPDGLDLFAEAPGRAFVVSGPERRRSTGSRIIGRVGGDRARDRRAC